MKHDEYAEMIHLALLTQTELSHVARIDRRRFADSISGERAWKPYEDVVCRAIAIRARVLLSRLAEYGHDDK